MNRLKKSGGFTLVELVIIIAVLGILASVAIPTYQNIVADAKMNACKAALGGMRSAISTYYATSAAKNPDGKPSWPTYKQLTKIGTILQGAIPANPYQNTKNYQQRIRNANNQKKGKTYSKYGWAYNQKTGEIWACTKTKGVNENTW